MLKEKYASISGIQYNNGAASTFIPCTYPEANGNPDLDVVEEFEVLRAKEFNTRVRDLSSTLPQNSLEF